MQRGYARAMRYFETENRARAPLGYAITRNGSERRCQGIELDRVVIAVRCWITLCSRVYLCVLFGRREAR
jgi:hypothetical protein